MTKLKGDVEFDDNKEDESYSMRKNIRDFSQISLANTVKRMHLARTNKQAERLLVILGAVSFILAILIIMYFVFGIGKQKKTFYYNPPARSQVSPASLNTKK